MKLKVLFISIAPPENDCGVRVVLYRHLVERKPFDLMVATTADYVLEPQPHVQIRLPYFLHRLKKSRFGPTFSSFLLDFQNFIWTLFPNPILNRAIESFKPDVLLVLADNCLGQIALKASKKYKIPIASLFLDWFPIMDGYYGQKWLSKFLSDRYRRLYKNSDLAFCTSDGMQEVLGDHPNSHIIYPMPGKHTIPSKIYPLHTGKFRIVYVGSVQNFYGRMICSLIKQLEQEPNIELIVVGPNADWDISILQAAKQNGIYLGFKPPHEAAEVLAGADSLLVVMSFEEKYNLFMKTSFTTKFLDYVAFAKPIILWGPQYCTPFKVAQKFGGAMIAETPNPEQVVTICKQIASDLALRQSLIAQAQELHRNLFNPDRLQDIFVSEITKLAMSNKLA